MPRKLVPIRIKITRSGNKMIYPMFNQISGEIRHGLDWSDYLDGYGIGHHYDKCCDFETQDFQYSITCVPKDFADAAVIKFPDLVTKLDENELQDYWDNHCHAHESEMIVANSVLEAIKLKRDLGISEDESDRNALNPDHHAPGVRRNQNKLWKTFKAHKDILITQ